MEELDVSGYYLHTPNETLYTVEFTADRKTYKHETLHVEDLFEKVLLGTEDMISGATPIGLQAKE